MTPALFLLLALGLGLAGWLVARARAWSFQRSEPGKRLAALPAYHGWFVALWTVLPMLVFALFWSSIAGLFVNYLVLQDAAAQALPEAGMQRQTILAEARAVARGNAPGVFNQDANALIEPFRDAMNIVNLAGIALILIIGFASSVLAYMRVKPDFRARSHVERIIMGLLLGASLIAILTTLGIFVSLVFEAVRFFGMVSPIDFLFGANWNPDPMSDPTTPDGDRYGAIPLFWGTIYIGVIIAMIVAIPLGMMSAIYLTQYADPRLRAWIKPMLEILAGVPTVVYGYFAALTIGPSIRQIALAAGVSNPAADSALSAGLVMGVMIIPFVSSMADDAIAAVPQSMRDGSLAMGATHNETIRKVLVPAALPGIVAGIMLAVSRAIGETMIVVMAATTAANLSADPLAAMTTVTVQIVALLTGDGDLNHPAALAAFALGFVLFLVTLTLNFIALRVVKRFREAYE